MNRILFIGGNSWLGCFGFPIVSGFPALFFAHRFWDGCPEPQQVEVLAAFSFGVAKAKSRPLYAVARGLTFLGIPDTVETGLSRFISNPRIDIAESRERLARSVIRALPRKKPVIVLADETSLRDRLKAMVVSVACEGQTVRGGDDDLSLDSAADGSDRDDSEDASGFGTERAGAET